MSSTTTGGARSSCSPDSSCSSSFVGSFFSQSSSSRGSSTYSLPSDGATTSTTATTPTLASTRISRYYSSRCSSIAAGTTTVEHNTDKAFFVPCSDVASISSRPRTGTPMLSNSHHHCIRTDDIQLLDLQGSASMSRVDFLVRKIRVDSSPSLRKKKEGMEGTGTGTGGCSIDSGMNRVKFARKRGCFGSVFLVYQNPQVETKFLRTILYQNDFLIAKMVHSLSFFAAPFTFGLYFLRAFLAARFDTRMEFDLTMALVESLPIFFCISLFALLAPVICCLKHVNPFCCAGTERAYFFGVELAIVIVYCCSAAMFELQTVFGFVWYNRIKHQPELFTNSLSLGPCCMAAGIALIPLRFGGKLVVALVSSRTLKAERALVSQLKQISLQQERDGTLLQSFVPPRFEEKCMKGEWLGYDEVDVAGIVFVKIDLLPRDPSERIRQTNEQICRFDEVVFAQQVWKVKSSFNLYLCSCSVPTLLDLAFALLEARLPSVQVRIGVHIGGYVAGIIGHDRWVYDCIGSGVNASSRVATLSPLNGISCLKRTKKVLMETLDFDIDPNDRVVEFESLGTFPLKGLGQEELFAIRKSLKKEQVSRRKV